ncbi:putative plastidic glucose transporter 1 [Camellia lanceoleosa]|uniref:Plastidic glucose transporter 1 n=1 Tax=Camellia lanceoleosa TaxID=1840588 RepID=A0ACC0HCT1_9ERIC|nr:putative plastidic glucose transporter 1 [Camellia lanceoleosa]
MWAAPGFRQAVVPAPITLTAHSNPKLVFDFQNTNKYPPYRLGLGFHPPPETKFRVPAAKKHHLPQLQTSKPNGESTSLHEEAADKGIDLGWLPAFPHVLVASMSNFLFGYHIGVMNGPIVSIARELGFEGNSFIEGLVVSIFIAGAFIGSIISGSLVDKLGCRRTVQVDTIPLILGAIISGQAHSLDEILWGRFLVGLGIGVNTVLVPIYISEVAPTKYRGSLGTLCQIGTCLGIIASLILGSPSENDPHWWRTILYIASVPGFILSLGMQFAVDSPRWLCKVGRLEDAKEVIRNLWGPSEVNKAIEEFQSVNRNDDLESRWLELLEQPHTRVAFIGGALFILQQFAGINGVLYFSSLTFQDVGITSGALASLFVGLTNFAGTLGALYLMDKQGRKRLMIGSYLGMAISMFLVVYAISSPMDGELGHNLSILGTVLYIFTFAIGAGPVTGLIIPELSSSRMRGKIMGFSFSVHWVCNFLVGLFFLELVEKFGVAPVYASFGAVSLLSAIFAYNFIVETKGRSLEEIEMSLNPNFVAKDE